MQGNIKIYTSDKCWNHILAELGANLVDSPDVADVIFDDIKQDAPISIDDLQNLILNQFDNNEIIRAVFGRDVVLPALQHKIVVALYKTPGIQIHELKRAVGVAPNITTHSVENAIYQLRKTFGRDFILNENGGYQIGRV